MSENEQPATQPEQPAEPPFRRPMDPAPQAQGEQANNPDEPPGQANKEPEVEQPIAPEQPGKGQGKPATAEPKK